MEDIFQILVFVVFAVLSFLPQVLKEKNKPVSSPHPARMEEDVEDWLSEEWKEKETGDTIILKDTVYIEKEVYKDRSEPPNNWEGTIILIIIALLIYKLK